MKKKLAIILVLLIIIVSSTIFFTKINISKENKEYNVVLIVIDTLRQDYLKVYHKNALAYTPAIDKLSKESIIFENAYSQAGWTKPSMASIITGLLPHRTNVFTSESKDPIKNKILSDNFHTLAEYFKENNYSTSAFISHNGHLNPEFGFYQGYNKLFYQNSSIVLQTPTGRDVLRTNDSLLTDQIIDEINKTSSNFFMQIHYMDIHSLARIPENNFNATINNEELEILKISHKKLNEILNNKNEALKIKNKYIEKYINSIEQTDKQIKRIIEKLKEKDIYNETIIIIMSDHGEEFFEHGLLGHRQLFEETIKIPLIMKIPGFQNQKINSYINQIDIFPTLLEIFGFKTKRDYKLDGKSLISLIKFKNDQSRIIITQTSQYDFSIIKSEWKYIYLHENNNLYNLKNDSNEKLNINDTNMISKLRNTFEKTTSKEPIKKEFIDNITISNLDEELRALGYLN